MIKAKDTASAGKVKCSFLWCCFTNGTVYLIKRDKKEIMVENANMIAAMLY